MTPLEESNSQGFVENEDFTGVYLKVQGNQYDGEQPTVSARALHTGLEISRRFSVWFETNSQGFVENEDYTSVLSGTVVNNGAHREIQDYSLSVDMAKHICLMSRTEKGKQIRQYFIDLEKAWNRRKRNGIRINHISWFIGGIATDLPPLQTYNTRTHKAVKSELLKNT